MAFWYQMMLAQQHPMAWTAAMMGQGSQGQQKAAAHLPSVPITAQVGSCCLSLFRGNRHESPKQSPHRAAKYSNVTILATTCGIRRDQLMLVV